MARAEIADLHASGRVPILVGGTGLYLRTLLDGIAPVPAIDPEVRRQVRERAVDENRAQLERLDPEAAERLKPADTARTARALEVVLSTGRTLAQWQAEKAGGIAERVELKPLILLPPRDWLYGRCDERFSTMVEEGALAEVEALLARNLDPDLPVMRAIGVAELSAHLRGEMSLDEAIAAGPAGDAALRQAPIYLVRAPAAGLVAAVHRIPARRRPYRRRARPARRAAMIMLRDADIDPSPLAGKRVADPRLRQSGAGPGAQPPRQRDRRRGRPSRRVGQHDRG